MKTRMYICHKIVALFFFSSWFTVTYAQEVELDDEGFQSFVMTDGDTSYVMKQYYLGLITAGPLRNQSEEETAQLQKRHLDYMAKLAENGKLSIAGPFGHDGDLRGIGIYNVNNFEEARALANDDPMVKVGRLEIEVLPWWAAKGSKLD